MPGSSCITALPSFITSSCACILSSVFTSPCNLICLITHESCLHLPMCRFALLSPHAFLTLSLVIFHAFLSAAYLPRVSLVVNISHTRSITAVLAMPCLHATYISGVHLQTPCVCHALPRSSSSHLLSFCHLHLFAVFIVSIIYYSERTFIWLTAGRLSIPSASIASGLIFLAFFGGDGAS